MGVFDFLLPDVDRSRRAALARLNAIKKRADAIDAAYEPIHRIAREVVPMIIAAEESGKRPTALRLTKADFDELTTANAHLLEMGHFTLPPETQGMCLYGLKIEQGEQRGVVT